MKEIENNMYYQTGIKTSRNEDSVYAMKYASQQMMIDKLQKENEQLKKELEQSNAVADTNKELAESFHKENERLKSLLKCDYEDNQEIMADIIKEKQELIDYLKLSIEFEKSNSLWTSKKRLKVYEEILSKIESGEK